MGYRGRTAMMTTSGVARMLHLHVNTVRRWSNRGILKPYRIGPRGDRRFKRDDITELLAQSTEAEQSVNVPQPVGTTKTPSR
jgi:excisionase family DNA binding protein